MNSNNQFSIEELQVINLQDSYSIMYAYLVRSLLDDCGIDGDAAAREGTRRYGADRGMTTRNKFLEMGVKINMENLFSVSFDLPPDPRFKRDRQQICPEERISHTLVCPMADVWKAIGEKAIGRMYCEEFHFACYNTFAYGYTQVNLARTLTQGDDEYCSFSVILRAQNLPEYLRAKCFKEYDPYYVEPVIPDTPVDAKEGFNTLWVKLYYHLLDASIERLGEAGRDAIRRGLVKLAINSAERLKKSAEEFGVPCDRAYVHSNYPLKLDIDDETMWTQYKMHNAKELLNDAFYQVFFRELGFES